MRQRIFNSLFLILVSILLFSTTSFIVYAQTAETVVHAVLFYSPTCPHCHKVITEDLTPLFEIYGSKLDIIGIDISQPGGQTLYQAAIQHFSIPDNRLGVPTLIVEDIVLVGSLEIPEQFPGLVDHYLARGGADWPDIPGLVETLPPSPVVKESTATVPAQSAAPQDATVPATVSPSSGTPAPTPGLIMTSEGNINWQIKFARDPVGNTLAIFVLIGMLAAVFWAIVLLRNQAGISLRGDWSWLIPALCVVGFGVAGYLAYVETAQVTAVCGPVGDCNTVQQSEYASLFGILPIGILGLFGYFVITTAWIIARYTDGLPADLAALALLAMSASGNLFSIYLTFLEPFVIGATCAWCLTSAALMTGLMLLSIRPAKLAYSKISSSDIFCRGRTRIGVHHD
jgi:uncharacterized membrane protein